MNTEDLFNGCSRNDDKAWEEAYNYVLVYLERKKGRDPFFEDLAQKTLLYFLKRGLQKIKNPLAFKKLLRLKANGLLIDSYRCSEFRMNDPLMMDYKSGEGSYENPKLEPVIPNLDNHIFHETILLQLDCIMNKLNERCKRVLKIYYHGKALGYEVKEIARNEGVPANTFSVRVKRCNESLAAQPEYRKILEEYSKD